MALVTTISALIGVLAAMAALLWFSAFMEAKHLGPAVPSLSDPQPEPAPAGAPMATVQPIRTAA